MHSETTSLRERNRASTWQSIHDAAAQLVLEGGLAAVTADEIAARAGCSRRTFFNYFPTKEDAVLGMRAPRIDAAELAAMERAEQGLAPFERTMRILIHILDDVFPVTGAHDRRRALIAHEPALRERFVAYITAAEALVLHHLQSRFESGERPAGLGPDLDQEQAKALLMLAGTIVRFAVVSDPDGLLEDRDAALARATTTFREVIEHTL